MKTIISTPKTVIMTYRIWEKLLKWYNLKFYLSSNKIKLYNIDLLMYT